MGEQLAEPVAGCGRARTPLSCGYATGRSTKPASIRSQAQAVNQGGNALFSVSACGSPPLAYHWYKNDELHPLGGDSSTLSIQNVQASDAGAYYVKVSNANGDATSSTAALVVNPALPPCATRPANLLGWWKAEGDANDASGNNYNGSFNVPAYAPGDVGQAFSFNGTSSYVTVTNFPDVADQLTIEFWLKRQRLTGAYEYVVEKGGDWSWGQQNFAVQLHGADNDLVFTWAGGFRGAGVINDYNWHHRAVVATAGQANPVIYIDGVARTITLSGGAGAISFPSFNRPLHIGAQVDPRSGSNYYGQTVIDELAIYNRALAAAEIQAIYNAGAAGKCAIIVPPTIITQPQSQTAAPGANVTFTVTASGTSPLSYQWFHAGAAVAGGTTSSLPLQAVQLGDSGEYKVTVANVAGAATSAGAILTVSKVSTPTIAPHGGSYTFIQDAVLSCATPGAVIHYTLSGAEPTESVR